MRSQRAFTRTACATLLVAIGFDIAPTHAQGLGRPEDPVVLVGSQLPSQLLGASVDSIIGYRYYAAANGWRRKPVQIDERLLRRYNAIYGPCMNAAAGSTHILTYADPLTATGPDYLPNFDADDELVFRAQDAGDRAVDGAGTPVAAPSGVDPNSGVELVVRNPTGSGLPGGDHYFYLFTRTSPPALASDDVAYAFDLTSTTMPNCTFNQCTDPTDPDQEYFCYYDTTGGNNNPEDSSVVTDAYSVHFESRWEKDELRITHGSASGVDILQLARFGSKPHNCLRDVEAFSMGPGAFLANKDGPVRAIRSYIGAFSGRLTHRTHRFYRQREDVETVLQAHPIAIVPLGDLLEYNDAASGMTYVNDVNLSPVTIDGIGDYELPHDTATNNNTNRHHWELVTSTGVAPDNQGSVVSTFRIAEASYIPGPDLDAALLAGHYYDGASILECGGALYCSTIGAGHFGFEYGLSGWRILPTEPIPAPCVLVDQEFLDGCPTGTTMGVVPGTAPVYLDHFPNTDPRPFYINQCGSVDTLSTWRTMYYDEPDVSLTRAQMLADQADHDVELVAATLWP